MSTRLLTDIRNALGVIAERLDAGGDPAAVAPALAALSTQLAQQALVLAHAEYGSGEAQKRLHVRALSDSRGLVAAHGQILAFVVDGQGFVDTLRDKGRVLDRMYAGADFLARLDTALHHLIDLMQYDEPQRITLDVRQGFRLTSGSAVYQRVPFGAPSNPDSTDD